MSSKPAPVNDSTPPHIARAEAQHLPSRYKRTAAGVIPQDWITASCDDLVDRGSPICYGVVQVGSHVDGGVPIVAIKFLKNIDSAPLHCASTRIERAYMRSRVKPGDVLLSIKGTIGRVGVVPEGFEGNISRDLARLRPRPGMLSSYIAHQLEEDSTQERISRAVVGTTRLELSIAGLRKLEIPVPSTAAEQRAIAEAVSSVDALIGALEALIAKKCAIKQVATQQLLVGKTRLPGFCDEWETKRLGDHVKFLRHGIYSRAELTSEGPVKYLHYGEIHTATGVYLDPGANPMPTLATARAKALDRLQNGDLVLVDASEDIEGVGKSVEVTGLQGQEVVSGLHTIAARFEKSVLADGFKAYLQFCPAFRDHLRRLAAGTKVYATNRAHIASVEMRLPALAEQAAIATVLSDMDAEIAALEGCSHKAQAIKQGMMQQLLTGRVRLVTPLPVGPGT